MPHVSQLHVRVEVLSLFFNPEVQPQLMHNDLETNHETTYKALQRSYALCHSQGAAKGHVGSAVKQLCSSVCAGGPLLTMRNITAAALEQSPGCAAKLDAPVPQAATTRECACLSIDRCLFGARGATGCVPAEAKEILHNLVEGIIDLFTYPCLG